MPPAGSLAEIAEAAITLAAVCVAVWQLSEGRRQANVNFARNAWTDYLKMAFTNPKLGSTEIARAASSQKTVQSLADGGEPHSERYLWFVTILLDSSESILEYLPTAEWRSAVRSQLRYHRKALKLLWDDKEDPWGPYYSDELNELVLAVIKQPDGPS